MQIRIVVLCLSLLTSSAWADLNGTMSDNGDGTYDVLVDNGEGHLFQGLATIQEDGRLHVDIHDRDDHTYTGLGNYKSDGYQVSFQNDVTGALVDSHIFSIY